LCVCERECYWLMIRSLVYSRPSTIPSSSTVPSHYDDVTHRWWIEIEIGFRVQEAKGLMGLKVHQGGFKPASFLKVAVASLCCVRESAINLMIRSLVHDRWSTIPSSIVPSHYDDVTHRQWNAIESVFKVWEAKRLMGVKVHQGGFKLAYSLIKSGGSLCEIDNAIDLVIWYETFGYKLEADFWCMARDKDHYMMSEVVSFR
jgi:hypothetical protein